MSGCISDSATVCLLLRAFSCDAGTGSTWEIPCHIFRIDVVPECITHHLFDSFNTGVICIFPQVFRTGYLPCVLEAVFQAVLAASELELGRQRLVSVEVDPGELLSAAAEYHPVLVEKTPRPKSPVSGHLDLQQPQTATRKS